MDAVSRLLLKAARGAETELVLFLIKKYKPKNINPEIFKWAVTSFSIPIVEALLEISPDMVNHVYHYLGTPLTIACIGQAPFTFVMFLLHSGADASLEHATVGHTTIQIAAAAYQDLDLCIDIMKALVRFGAKMDGDVLAWAAKEGRVLVMHYLLTMGVTHERDPIRMREIVPIQQLALHVAARGGHWLVVLELLLSSVDANCRNGNNLTAMALAQRIERAGLDTRAVQSLILHWERRKRNYDFGKDVPDFETDFSPVVLPWGLGTFGTRKTESRFP
jgi:hypothetical protein